MPDNQNTPEPPKENEIADYVEGIKKLEMQGFETGIKKARTALFVTAALVFISELVAAGTSEIGITPLLIGIALFEAGVFVALALWTKTKPYSAIMVGLILFILMWVAAIFINGGKAVYSGIIVKIVVITYLAKALKDAKAWEETKKNL
jgi:uncharacterized membrane protein YoaK (UPF0700 family)